MKRFEDTVFCPEGHVVVINRKVSTAGKQVTTTCKECGYSHRIAAGYPPGVEPPSKYTGPTHERQIEHRLVKRVKELGGEVRKVKWIGRTGAPDRLVMLPRTPRFTVAELCEWFKVCGDVAEGMQENEQLPARTIWVELKAPGRKASLHQAREHERMRKMGQRVEVVDSYERIEEILK